MLLFAEWTPIIILDVLTLVTWCMVLWNPLQAVMCVLGWLNRYLLGMLTAFLTLTR